MKKLLVPALLIMALTSFGFALSPLVEMNGAPEPEIAVFGDFVFSPLGKTDESAKAASCNMQCRWEFNQCVRNSGDLCGCVTAYEACLSNCN